PLAVCDCHIGYVHLESLPLYDVFAGGVLERIPAPPPPVGAWSVGHTVSPSIPLVTMSVTEPDSTEDVIGTESPLLRPSPPG
ncbi:radical SAM protein, partial [Streptomyces milbemycinicus]